MFFWTMDDEYNNEDIGYLWDERTEQKTIACFSSFFFGRLGWTATLTRDRLPRRTRLGRSIWRTTLLFCSVYAIMFLFFLLNLYIEAGLVYRTLSLQKDRAEKKDRNWGLFPSKCSNGVCMSLPQSPSLFCLTFSLLPVFDEKQPTLQSLKSSSEDKIVRKPGGSSTGQPDSVHTKWWFAPF